MTVRRLLTVAGSDSSGGAGIQADLKTFAALGVHGMSVLTAVTAQNSQGVSAIWQVPVTAIVAQLRAVLDDVGVDAIKIGMVPTAAAARALHELLGHLRVPVVVDPVGATSHGQPLQSSSALAATRRELLPLATVLTPNLAEVRALCGVEVATEADLAVAAAALLRLGPRWVLVKGGHLPGRPIDLLATAGEELVLGGSRIASRHDHGTGCTLAAALAVGLAEGRSVPDAARRAKQFVTAALESGYPLGSGVGPVNPGGLVSRP
ncbi:MAG: bifunctional hydroxymethylpyrimidine kinase/phosphomethylpyrimidine kinase [Mycobacteriales bacterium]